MFTNIKAISKILHQGTFSYKKFKTETKLCGQVLKYEYQYEYVHEDKFIYCDRDIGFNNSAFERGLTICNNIFGVYNEICSNYQR